MSQSTTFTLYLKSRHYSVTKSRLAVFEAMLSSEPLTMNELVRKVGTGVDRASIYRTISLFETLGIASRITRGWKYKLELTGQFSQHHHHLYCQSCEQVIDFAEKADLLNALEKAAGDRGYQMLSHQVEITGLCHTCQHEAFHHQK